jgi:lysophospholipase L1-like esterase
MAPALDNKPPSIPSCERTSRRRRRVFSLILLGVLLTGQEIVTRLVFPLPEVVGFNRIHYQRLAPGDARSKAIGDRGLVYDRLGFESRPDGYSEVHRLNLYGFRGSDFTIEPSQDRRRILILGDSVVEGQGASEPATISSVFAKLLRNDGIDAEVINLGVVAASLHELTPLARDSIALLKPRDVILVLYANDLPAPPFPRIFDQPATTFRRQARPASPRLLELLIRLASKEPIYRRWPPHQSVPFFLPVPDSANPWTDVTEPPAGLDPNIFQAMRDGNLNPWLWHQSQAIPGMLSHDFSGGDGSPAAYLERIAAWCQARDARLTVAYVPFCGVTSGRYASSLVKMGMEQSVAEALDSEPIYRRQNEVLASLARTLQLPLADTTDALIQAEAQGTPQYWSFDTHPRPSGYATIASHIYNVWRESASGR